MAVNVYMVFFLAANPVSFRKYLWVYCVICFGAPALPAVILLFIHDQGKGSVYGNATVSSSSPKAQLGRCRMRFKSVPFSDKGTQKLWCWIGDSWNSLRIFTYYLPIWVCIMLSAIIYVAVGYHVFHQRNQLRNLTLSNPAKDLSSADVRDSDERVSSSLSLSISPQVRTPAVRTKHSTLLQTAEVRCICRSNVAP